MQVACDALIVSAIVYLTGGVASYFSSLYTLPIIAASTVQSWRGGLMVSVLSSVMLGGIVVAPVRGRRRHCCPRRGSRFSRSASTCSASSPSPRSAATSRRGCAAPVPASSEASTQLADLQAFNQHVIDSLTSGLATTDMQGRLLTFNRAAETITGLAAAEAVGTDAVETLQLPGAAGRDGRAASTASQRADGRHIEVGITAAPLITPRGNSGFLFTFQDVTELKKRDREARVQQRLAAVGEMAAGIAHEIRNPLASMSGSIQILRHELSLTTEQSQLMDIVLRESDRLNDTIRSFLAFARPQRNAMSDLDVRRSVTDAARLLENNAEVTARHKVVVDVPAEPVIFRADEAQIRQIVWNLATNGLRAMPDGGTLRLALRHPGASAAVDGGEVVIAVHDEGVGIAPEELDGIFQPFRGGFARGTGLGLSIVHRIVTDYGGEVRVASEKGKGTTVEVALPLAAAETVCDKLLAGGQPGVA